MFQDAFAIRVAMAAPSIPYLGIRIRFNMMFKQVVVRAILVKTA